MSSRFFKETDAQRKAHAFAKEEYPDLYHDDGTIDLTSASALTILTDFVPPKAYNRVGYARSLGGFFYQFFFAIIGAAFLSVFYPFTLSFLYPFPESQGYGNVAGALLAIASTIINIPTGGSLERFIGEWRVKDSRRMLHYIRFYLWYNMMAGLIYLTGFSLYTLSMWSANNELTWAKWIILVLIIGSWPNNQGIFITTIRGLQQFNFESWYNFITSTILSPLFEVIFVLYGRFILGANPAIGALMGIAIMGTIGGYIQGFFNMLLGMYLLRRVLKPMGYTIRDLFTPKIDKEVVKSILKWGLAVSYPGLIGSVIGTVTILWNYTMIPAYTTLSVLSSTADNLANLIKKGGAININATLAEAINNGKMELTNYYIAMQWKFEFFFMFAIGSIIISFMPLLVSVLFNAIGATEYVLAAAFIAPNLIATVIQMPQGDPGTILTAANEPVWNSNTDLFFNILNTGILYIWLFVIHVGDLGLTVIIWWLPLWSFPTAIIVTVIKWHYISKHVVQVKWKSFFWQTFIAPIIPAIIIGIVAQLWIAFVFPPLALLIGGTGLATVIAGVITILFAFIVCLMFMFFPLYTVVGGNDTNTLAIFHEACEISGPSRFLFKPIDKAMSWLAKKSKLHNRFVIPYEDAEREAQELMQEKFIIDKLVTKLIKQTGTV